MTMKRVTPFTRPPATVAPWEGTALVLVDASFVPTMLRDLEARKLAYFYPDEASHAVGYDTVCKAQEALLMDVSERIIMEVRATRGIDDTHPEIFDPASDPFTLSLGTIMDNQRAVDLATAKLEEIRALIAAQESPAELADILDQLGIIAALLA